MADLLGRMTLEEKAAQMQHQAPAIPRLGIPAYDWWSEALHGVARAGRATVFPQAIGLAATWDTNLMHARGRRHLPGGPRQVRGLGAEGSREIYEGLTFFSPNINIFRDPRWGRGQETYGEDPYLTGRLAVAFIHGMQGDDPALPTRRGHRQALRRALRPRARSATHSTRWSPPAISRRPTCPRSRQP